MLTVPPVNWLCESELEMAFEVELDISFEAEDISLEVAEVEDTISLEDELLDISLEAEETDMEDECCSCMALEAIWDLEEVMELEEAPAWWWLS